MSILVSFFLILTVIEDVDILEGIEALAALQLIDMVIKIKVELVSTEDGYR